MITYKHLAIVAAAVGLYVGIVTLTLALTNATDQHLQVVACKHEAKLANLDDTYCKP